MKQISMNKCKGYTTLFKRQRLNVFHQELLLSWITPLIKDVLKQKHRASRAGNNERVKYLARKVEKLINKI